MLRSLLSVGDLSPEDLASLIERSAVHKRAPEAVPRILDGASVTLYFDKPSTRTRIAFEAAIFRLGGHPIMVTPAHAQTCRGESLEDTIRVIERYSRAFIVRTFRDDDLARYHAASRIPIINALTDGHHPCQAIADLFTLHERFGALRGLKLAYVGAGNNVVHSLLEAAALAGIEIVVASPASLGPEGDVVARARAIAQTTGATVSITDDPDAAVAGAHAVYTDTWLSMGDPEDERARRLEALERFRVDDRLMGLATRDAVFLHCLPAHRGEEVSAAVADGPRSLIFTQAENKLHTSIAILEGLLLGGLRGATPQQRGSV